MEEKDRNPEHEKLHKIQAQSQACHDFLEWLAGTKKFHLGYYHKHGPECPGWDPEREKINFRDPGPHCAYREDELYSANYNDKELLAEFFGIDLKKLEEEKLKMLEEIRTINNL